MTINLKTLPHGDMPGDKIAIEQQHIDKAEKIYPLLRQLLPQGKCVVCVCGGSGVGKSEIASLLAGMLQADGIGSYVMSGDNYPHRIPCENDAAREKVYAEGGREALQRYLGSQQEIDFELVSAILARFHAGAPSIPMKRMGRTPDALWYDDVDFSQTQVLILEWTHGNSDNIRGVDIPILLNSTPQETLEHRRKRNRDGGVDSPFTAMVLELEQKQLMRQAHKAKIIVTKSGELISYQEYCRLMEEVK
ncbi:MAG TPA: adenylylsulfate kinase [Candidatus Faecousia intestinigallinarum]|nr:adenylylsulfate kinase [Candidatus Faecousia intestinigallinarum]